MDVNQDNRIPETPNFYSSWNMRLDYSSVQQHIFCPGAMVENIYKNTYIYTYIITYFKGPIL